MRTRHNKRIFFRTCDEELLNHSCLDFFKKPEDSTTRASCVALIEKFCKPRRVEREESVHSNDSSESVDWHSLVEIDSGCPSPVSRQQLTSYYLIILLN
jgi:hypothetical protein